MLVQAQHCFSVKDYQRMAETGVLPPEARVELLDGKIIEIPPIGPFHGGAGQTFKPDDQAMPQAFTDVVVEVAELFKR